MTSLVAYGSWMARDTLVDLSPSREIDALTLHDAHVDFVWKTLQRLGVRVPDLEDAVQDVFLVVHRKLSTFDPEQPAQAWIYGICRKVAASHRRRAQSRREIACDAVPEVEDEGRDPEEQASRRQAQDRLDALLDGLDDDKRVVFVMFEIEGASCEEIAEALSIPVGTVYSRLHTARKALQRAAARSDLRNHHERPNAPPPSRR